MKKVIIWTITIVLLVLFFVFIDDSGIDFKAKFAKIKDQVTKKLTPHTKDTSC